MRRRRRWGDERGAALIEVAVTLPLLVLIVLGIIEFGSAWSNKLKVETAARGGARVGSGLGADRMADYGALQSVKSVLTDLGLDNVDYVVVYKASDADGDIPTGCTGSTPTSQTGKCNVYSGAQLGSLTQADFTGTTSCGGGAPDHFWCPTSRQSVQHLGNDYVGVWIKANSQTLTNFFGSPLGLQSAAVMRLEPKG
ncbi:MAG: TadE/TadG family type IV pilus assembly protein [Acidimicrobiia bacterium]